MSARRAFCAAVVFVLLSCSTAVGASPQAQPVRELADRTAPRTLLAEPAPEADEPGNLLLLDVSLERSMVASAMTSYEVGNAIFVPLGELARVLTLSIRVDAVKRRASGFILNQQRSFDLDLTAGRVTVSGRAQPVDAADFRVLDDEIYVDTAALENWWPVRLRPDRSRLVLEVVPREALPLQLRLARERTASLIGNHSGPKSALLSEAAVPFRAMTWPAIDQTLSFNVGHSSTERSYGLASTSHLTGDLLGLEAAAYVGLNTATGEGGGGRVSSSTLRLALGRSDPLGRALGALPSTSFSLGHVRMFGVSHLYRTNTAGLGATVSNMPLERGSNFSSTSFQGALPPGWDVELYFNDALVGYQQSRTDSTYSFVDQPLLFGENRFRLVFHGPQGQTRVETRNLNFDSSTVRPKEWLYALGVQRDANQLARGMAQVEYGVSNSLSVQGGVVAGASRPGLTGRRFANGALRLFLDGWLFSSEWARCLDCAKGNLLSMGFNRRLAYGSLTASQTLLNNFVSEIYPSSSDDLRSSTKVRLDLSLPVSVDRPMPVTTQLQLDRRRSGATDSLLVARASHSLAGSTVTHEIASQAQAGRRTVLGGLLMSRQLNKASLRGQLLYRVSPTSRVDTGLVSADWRLQGDQLLNVAATRHFEQRESVMALTWNRNFGSHALRVGLSRSSSGVTTAGIQIFTSLTRDPGAQRWMFAALPGANNGSASARVFLDRNLNGAFDPGDEPVQGANFFVNGTGTPVRTDSDGLAYIPRLSPHRVTGIQLNTASLEDSRWTPSVAGVTFTPRAGRSVAVDFPVVSTAEIDGYVQLEANGQRQGVSDVQLELFASDGRLASRVRSTADGYFLISDVRPGRYEIKVEDKQLKRLGLEPVPAQQVVVSADGEADKSYDFVLRRVAKPR